jgi:hypothetical protein
MPLFSLAQSSVQGKIIDKEKTPITNVKITIPELNTVLFSNESGLFSLIQGNRNLLLFIEKIKHPKYGEITRGLDLITVPPMDKIEILSLIFDEFHSLLKRNSDSYEKRGILEPIPKRDIDKILDKTGSKNSIFGFKNVFISDINILSLEDWFKLPYLKFSAIQGLDIQGIYKRYRN